MHPAWSSALVRVISTLLSALLVSLPLPSWPQNDPDARATLKDIPAILVLADYSNLDAGPVELKREQLQADVEGRLRKAGIRVISSPERTGWSYLYLDVKTQKAPHGLYAYHIRLEFDQPVLLPRNQNARLLAPTWSVSDLGTVEAQRLIELREGVADMVDQFISAFLGKDPLPKD